MKKNILLMICLVAISACATMEEDFSFYEPDTKTRKFVSFRQVYAGMTRKEVTSVLGKEVIIGYEAREDQKGLYRPVLLENPHRQEKIVKGKKSYDVDYYFAGITEPDGKISEDELMPLVFLNDQLVGMGWDYLNQKIKSQ